MQPKKRVLIVCTGNSARRRLPVMREFSVDISSQTAKPLDQFLGQPFDFVITVCDKAREQCPAFPEYVRLHRPFEDPAAKDERSPEQRLQGFRDVRDKIYARIMFFLGEDSYYPNQDGGD